MPTQSTNTTTVPVLTRVPKSLVLELCFFSDLVYEAETIAGKSYKQKIEYKLPAGWSVVANSREHTATSVHNYCGMLFINEEEHQAVIAHGGTDPLSIHDMSDGIKLYNHDMPDKIPVMQRFVRSVSKNIPQDYVIYMTGHSAGGVMSDLAALEYTKIGRDKVKLSCSFDNPGSLPFASELYSEGLIERTLENTQMLAFQARPNFFNTIAPHLAERHLLVFSHRLGRTHGVEELEYKYDLHVAPDTRTMLHKMCDTLYGIPYAKLPTVAFGACKVLLNSALSTMNVVGAARKALLHSTEFVKFKTTKFLLEHSPSPILKLLNLYYGTDDIKKLLPYFVDFNAMKYSAHYMHNFQEKWSSYSATTTQLIFRLCHVGDHPLSEFMEALRHTSPVLYKIQSGYGYGPAHNTVTVSSPPRVSAQLRARAGTGDSDSVSVASVDSSVASQPMAVVDDTSSSVWTRVMQTPRNIAASLTGSQYGKTPVLMRSRSDSMYEEDLEVAAELFGDTGEAAQQNLLTAEAEMPRARADVTSPGHASIYDSLSDSVVRGGLNKCVKNVVLTKNMVLMLLTLRAMKTCATKHLIHPSISMDDVRDAIAEKALEAEMAAQKARAHCSNMVDALEDTMCDAAGRAKESCTATVEHCYQMAADCQKWVAAQIDGYGHDTEWVDVTGAHDTE